MGEVATVAEMPIKDQIESQRKLIAYYTACETEAKRSGSPSSAAEWTRNINQAQKFLDKMLEEQKQQKK